MNPSAAVSKLFQERGRLAVSVHRDGPWTMPHIVTQHGRMDPFLVGGGKESMGGSKPPLVSMETIY